MKCPEDPEALCGQPIGQYHCPVCACMQVACTPHMCEPELCLLENCDCLPEGRTKSINLVETEHLEKIGQLERLLRHQAEQLEEVLRTNDQLQARLAESEAENDQWQKKLAEVWAEVASLRERAE